jgi:hypothetical protein
LEKERSGSKTIEGHLFNKKEKRKTYWLISRTPKDMWKIIDRLVIHEDQTFNHQKDKMDLERKRTELIIGE